MVCAHRWTALLTALWLGSAAMAANAAVPGVQQSEWRQVLQVVDGDTLRLKNGEKLRLIGINTPELRLRGRRRGMPEPLAETARSALQTLIGTDNPRYRVLLQSGSERRDRYGRLLAHARHPDGRLLAAELLRQGLGMQAMIPPNTAHWEEYAAAEAEAREALRGVWDEPYYAARPVASLGSADTGFRRVLGVARTFGQRRRSALLMGKRLYLPVPSASLVYFRDHWLWDTPGGTCIELRGWLVIAGRSGDGLARLRMSLHHPALLMRRPDKDCHGIDAP